MIPAPSKANAWLHLSLALLFIAQGMLSFAHVAAEAGEGHASPAQRCWSAVPGLDHDPEGCAICRGFAALGFLFVPAVEPFSTISQTLPEFLHAPLRVPNADRAAVHSRGPPNIG